MINGTFEFFPFWLTIITRNGQLKTDGILKIFGRSFHRSHPFSFSLNSFFSQLPLNFPFQLKQQTNKQVGSFCCLVEQKYFQFFKCSFWFSSDKKNFFYSNFISKFSIFHQSNLIQRERDDFSQTDKSWMCKFQFYHQDKIYPNQASHFTFV